MGKISISYFGKMINLPSPGELNYLCDKIKNDIPCKTIILNKRTNSIATPTSMLNMLNLKLQNGDEIEFILLADTEHELSTYGKKVKEILSKYIKFN